MTACKFEKLVDYLDKRLNLNARLELFDHLDRCYTCREAIYHIARDRDSELYLVRPKKAARRKAG